MLEKEISVILPCRNEIDSIGFCIENARRFIEETGKTGEIIVVDNGSTDGSGVKAEQCGAMVIKEMVPGYGSAIRAGIRASRGKYIVMCDADASYDFMDAIPMIQFMDAGYQMVVGNRFQGGIEKGAMPFSHKIGAPALSFLASLRFTRKVHDFHCGIRAFDGNLARAKERAGEFLCTGMDFATELIAEFAKEQARIVETPAILRKDRRICSKSHLRAFPDGMAHLRYIMLGVPNESRRAKCGYNLSKELG